VAEKAICDGDVMPDLVIGADTIVDLEGQVLEKPDGAAGARSMLNRLSGSSHQVHTGVVLVLPRAVDPATGKSPLVRARRSVPLLVHHLLEHQPHHHRIMHSLPP